MSRAWFALILDKILAFEEQKTQSSVSGETRKGVWPTIAAIMIKVQPMLTPFCLIFILSHYLGKIVCEYCIV